MSSLSRFWIVRGHLVEGWTWLERALAANTEPPYQLEIRLVKAAAFVANGLDEHATVTDLTNRRLELARSHDDQGESRDA